MKEENLYGQRAELLGPRRRITGVLEEKRYELGGEPLEPRRSTTRAKKENH